MTKQPRQKHIGTYLPDVTLKAFKIRCILNNTTPATFLREAILAFLEDEGGEMSLDAMLASLAEAQAKMEGENDV